MFLLDTCVLSESPKPDRNEHLVAWVRARQMAELHISAVTAGELRYGVDRLPAGRRADELKAWLLDTMQSGFAGRILPLDQQVANVWAALRARYPNAQVADSQIAATALAHRLTLVTHNVKDFAFDGLSVFNPWRR